MRYTKLFIYFLKLISIKVEMQHLFHIKLDDNRSFVNDI